MIRPPNPGLIVAAALAVLLVVGVPAAGLGTALFGPDASEGLVALWRQARVGELLGSTLLLGVGVALLSTVSGVWLAWAGSRLALRGRQWLTVLALLPLATPSYLVAAAAERSIFQPGGPFAWLRGLPAAVLVISLVTTPVVLLIARSALARGSASEEEAARSLGAGRWELWWAVLLPRLRPAIAFGFVLSLVYAVSDFGAVAVLDTPVLTWRLYQAVAGAQLGRAVVLGLALIVSTLPLLVLAAWLRGGPAGQVANPRPPAPLEPSALEWGLAWAGHLGLALAGTVLPAWVLGAWVFEGHRAGRLDWLGVLEPTWHTLVLAALGTVVTLAIAALPAWVAARGRGAWLRQAAWMASALPGPLLAFGWLLAALALGRTGWVSYAWLLGTGILLFLGYATRFLAEAMAPLETGVLNLDPRQEAAARALGAGRVRWLVEVALPSLVPGGVTAAMLTFVAILKELPITLLLGGPSGWRTLAFRTFDRYNEALFHDAGLAGLCLLGLTLSAVLITLRMQAR